MAVAKKFASVWRAERAILLPCSKVFTSVQEEKLINKQINQQREPHMLCDLPSTVSLQLELIVALKHHCFPCKLIQ